MSDAGDRLKAVRAKAGYGSAREAALAMGVSVATYGQHENGTRNIPSDRAERYAKFFRTTPELILYGKRGEADGFELLGPVLYVKGPVGAGLFREAWEYDQDDWERFTGRADIAAPLRERFGLRVVGESMNEIYPHDTILECTAFYGQHALENGKRVIVQRFAVADGIETTVKEYMRDKDGVEWLIPRSHNPAFQIPLRMDVPQPGIERIEIIGIVVASVRPE